MTFVTRLAMWTMLVKYAASQDGVASLGSTAERGAMRVDSACGLRAARHEAARPDVMPWIFAIATAAVSAIITKEVVVRSAAGDVAHRMGDKWSSGLVQRADAAVLQAASDVSVAEESSWQISRSWEENLVGPPVSLMNDYVDPVGPPALLAGGFAPDPAVRWFDARPVKPARVIWMTVTAYSPDPRSCGDSADGITATLHCVTTNGHNLVAADPKILAYGSMLTIPGYAIGAGAGPREPAIVPVLDCGGAIKGYRLDVLFPTHEEALAWGVRELPVTVWAYADGGSLTNPRKVR